ncbi:MAG: hypothetical protein FWB80_15275 [Defluviitaleaceae bacterium]|nr:hypothetical protein [Defluviitaleaceae bacterium]
MLFIKSMLRQPLRTVLLMLLIATASFAFVLRVVERQIIVEKIHELSQYYRTIGFLQPTLENNVFGGAEILRQSPYLAFEDRRRAAAGVMRDFPNADFIGLSGDPEYDTRYTDAFFYAVVNNIVHLTDRPLIRLVLQVEEVVQGFPEHAVEGQILLMYHNADINMQIGERYFLRGVYYRHGIQVPRIGSRVNTLSMRPLCADSQIWYTRSAADIPHLAAEIEHIRRNQHAIELRSTRDMTAIPFMQPEFGIFHIIDGRKINHDDYINARPVVMIHRRFAIARGLEPGDMLTVDLSTRQYVAGSVAEKGFSEILLHGAVGDITHVLELEIVGTFHTLSITRILCQQSPGRRHIMATDTMRDNTTLFLFAYIPESILPAEITIYPWYEDNFLPQEWYSFTLSDTRDEYPFVQKYETLLTSAGYRLFIIESEADNFWRTAENILLTVNFNVVAFSVLAAAIFGLVIFIFIFQRRKEAHIMWALGCNRWKVRARLFVCFLFFALPAVFIGGLAARPLAQSFAAQAIYVPGESDYNDIYR